MRITTHELDGEALDWAVAQITDTPLDIIDMPSGPPHIGLKGRTPDGWPDAYSPSTDWAQGGPLIERHQISIAHNPGMSEPWEAELRQMPSGSADGETPLVAAMRALCAGTLGDAVDVPDEITHAGLSTRRR